MKNIRLTHPGVLKCLFPVIFFTGGIFAQTHNNELDIDQNRQRIERAKECVQRNPDSSIYYITPVVENSGSVREMIQARSILGDAYQYKQHYDKAVDQYHKALELGENDEIPGILANAYNGLGMTYFALNEMDKAEKYILKAADEKLEIDDYLYFSVIRSNLAVIYNRKEDYDQSNEILRSTEKVLIKHNELAYLPNIYMTLGANFESGTGNFDSARIYYQKAVDIGEKHNALMEVKTACLNLADIALSGGQYSEALNYLYRAKSIATNRKLDQLNVAVLNKISDAYEALNRYDSAYYYKKNAMALHEEVFNVEKQKQIDDLELKYETAKKEREIEQQKTVLHQSQIENERAKNQLYIIVFSGILMFLGASGTAVYYWQRRRNSELLEAEKTKVFENVVHDIRTPLTLIAAPLEVIKNELSTNKRLAGQINLVEQNTGKLSALVNELLDVTRLKNRNFTPVYGDGNIALFLKDVVRNFKGEANRKKIKIEVRAEDDPKNYRFPVNVVEKVVNNLISNSLKYCPEHSIISVDSKIENNRLILKVKDNGPGIAPKEGTKVFDRFYRVAGGTEKGVGIGLSIVKELIEQTGGKIKLNMEMDEGTEFTCFLPVKESTAEVGKPLAKGELPRLLIADNDPDILQFVSRFLESDFEVLTAQNGARGIELAKEYVPDLILTDVMMPVKDGIELLQEVKNEEVTRHIPVAIFSVKTAQENRLKGLEHGADAYIPKPFSTEELRLTLKNILTTIERSQREFQERIQSKETFEKRLKSKSEFINKATGFVIEHIENANYNGSELASDLCISRSQLHRKLSSLTGFSTANFIKMIRLEKAKDMLERNCGNVTEIAYSCGFNSQSYFTKSFKAYFGKSPSSFLRS